MKNMNIVKSALTAVKIVGGIAISIGVGAVVKNLVRATTPEDVKKGTEICIKVGSFFIAGMLATAANDKFGQHVDAVIQTIEVVIQGHGNNEELIIDVEVQ